MTLVRSTVSRALEARDKAGMRVRQPLSKLQVAATDFETLPMQAELLSIIADEVNVKQVVVSSGVNSGEVVLDTTLTDELREEGLVRETIREIQSFRKEQKLRPGEEATYRMPSSENRALIEKHLAHIQKETTTKIEFLKTEN